MNMSNISGNALNVTFDMYNGSELNTTVTHVCQDNIFKWYLYSVHVPMKLSDMFLGYRDQYTGCGYNNSMLEILEIFNWIINADSGLHGYYRQCFIHYRYIISFVRIWISFCSNILSVYYIIRYIQLHDDVDKP